MIQSNAFNPQFGNKWRVGSEKEAQAIQNNFLSEEVVQDTEKTNASNSWNRVDVGKSGTAEHLILIASNHNESGKGDLNALYNAERTINDALDKFCQEPSR